MATAEECGRQALGAYDESRWCDAPDLPGLFRFEDHNPVDSPGLADAAALRDQRLHPSAGLEAVQGAVAGFSSSRQ